MIERLKAGLAVAAAVALLIPFMPQGVDAQQGGRFRVIVPNVIPTDDSDPHFGDRVSGYLRDMINLPTHIAMSKTEIEERADELDVRYEDLNDCITARQFAQAISAPLVMCGEYEDQGGEYLVEVSFFTVPDGDELIIDPFTAGHEEWIAAAEHLSESFNRLVEDIRTLDNCNQALQSSNWGEAIEQCGRALEVTPESFVVRRALASAYLETEQWDEALEHYEILLEERPREEGVLQSAGWVAGQAGEVEQAREYYTRYLEINPDDVDVRIRVAYDLAETGDPYGAMTLLEEGLEQQPDNVDLHDNYGTYAFRAAAALQEEEEPEANSDTDEPEIATEEGEADAPELSSEIEDLYRRAIDSYELVLEERGSEARVSHATNAMRAYRQLGEYQEAIRIGEMATDLFPDEASVQGQLASAYNESGDVDSAIAALDRALEINPDLPQAHMRQGVFLMQARRVDEGIAALQAAADAGEESADQLARMVFSYGYSGYVEEGQFEEGLRIIEAAKEFDVSEEVNEELNFFHGWSLVQYAEQVQEPGTLQAAQTSLPMFQEAREHLQAGRAHAERTGQDFQELMNYVDTYISIQEAVIQREGRRR